MAEPAACPPISVTPVPPSRENMIMVIDGAVQTGIPDTLAMPVDSVFELRIVSDSAGLAALGHCAGTHAIVVTSLAEAARRGLRAPPPALCVRSPDSRLLPRQGVPVGQQIQLAAGQLDFLSECDRPPPPGIRWASSDTTVLVVDSLGLASARAPGQAEIIVTAGGGEGRLRMRVIPP